MSKNIKPKLKTLLSYLKYVLLEENGNKSVMINNPISQKQERKLVQISKGTKKL